MIKVEMGLFLCETFTHGQLEDRSVLVGISVKTKVES